MARPSPLAVIRFIGRSSKRIAVTVAGFAFVLLGIALIPLPGPGFLVIILGLAILATEYAWAAAMLERTKEYAAKGGNVAKDAYRKVRSR
jgi:uncharacterized protein (TIGR02611 family)